MNAMESVESAKAVLLSVGYGVSIDSKKTLRVYRIAKEATGPECVASLPIRSGMVDEGDVNRLVRASKRPTA